MLVYNSTYQKTIYIKIFSYITRKSAFICEYHGHFVHKNVAELSLKTILISAQTFTFLYAHVCCFVCRQGQRRKVKDCKGTVTRVHFLSPAQKGKNGRRDSHASSFLSLAQESKQGERVAKGQSREFILLLRCRKVNRVEGL
jgi:hypothetical protein